MLTPADMSRPRIAAELTALIETVVPMLSDRIALIEEELSCNQAPTKKKPSSHTDLTTE